MYLNGTGKPKKSPLLHSLISLTLLASSGSVSSSTLLGAYLPGDGWDTGQTDYFNSISSKPIGFQVVFSAFSHDWDQLYWQANYINAAGSVPMVTWMPVDLERPDVNLLIEINQGLWDTYIDDWAIDLKGYVKSLSTKETSKILLRFAHEPNGNWYPYSNTPNEFVSAWQRIHQRFEELEVNHYIDWVWNINNVSIDNYDDISQYYPGDEYVDWTSVDGFNFGSNYDWSSWDEFDVVFADTIQTLATNFPEKPIMIAEMGSAEPSDVPDPKKAQFGSDDDMGKDKNVWIRSALESIETNFPLVKAVAIFNLDSELSWSISNVNSSGLKGYNSGIQSDNFVSTMENISFDTNDLAIASLSTAGIDIAGVITENTDNTTLSMMSTTTANLSAPDPCSGRPTAKLFRREDKKELRRYTALLASQKSKSIPESEMSKTSDQAEKRKAIHVESKARKLRIRAALTNKENMDIVHLKTSKFSVINY